MDRTDRRASLRTLLSLDHQLSRMRDLINCHVHGSGSGLGTSSGTALGPRFDVDVGHAVFYLDETRRYGAVLFRQLFNSVWSGWLVTRRRLPDGSARLTILARRSTSAADSVFPTVTRAYGTRLTDRRKATASV